MHSLGNAHVPLQQLWGPLSPDYYYLQLSQGDSNSSWKIKGSFYFIYQYCHSTLFLSILLIPSLSRQYILFHWNSTNIPALKNMSKKCKNSYNLDQNLVQSYEFFGWWPRPVWGCTISLICKMHFEWTHLIFTRVRSILKSWCHFLVYFAGFKLAQPWVKLMMAKSIN